MFIIVEITLPLLNRRFTSPLAHCPLISRAGLIIFSRNAMVAFVRLDSFDVFACSSYFSLFSLSTQFTSLAIVS